MSCTRSPNFKINGRPLSFWLQKVVISSNCRSHHVISRSPLKTGKEGNKQCNPMGELVMGGEGSEV